LVTSTYDTDASKFMSSTNKQKQVNISKRGQKVC